MKKIILDTNFLLIPAQFKVDIFSEIERICGFPYKLCIIDKSLEELKKIIEKQRGKNKRAAILGFALIKQKALNIITTAPNKSADDSIVESADKQTIVATQDIALKKRLKSKGIRIITLRQKKYLKID